LTPAPRLPDAPGGWMFNFPSPQYVHDNVRRNDLLNKKQADAFKNSKSLFVKAIR